MTCSNTHKIISWVCLSFWNKFWHKVSSEFRKNAVLGVATLQIEIWYSREKNESCALHFEKFTRKTWLEDISLISFLALQLQPGNSSSDAQCRAFCDVSFFLRIPLLDKTPYYCNSGGFVWPARAVRTAMVLNIFQIIVKLLNIGVDVPPTESYNILICIQRM